MMTTQLNSRSQAALQILVPTKLEVYMAFLFRENRRHCERTDRQTWCNILCALHS